MKDMLSKLYVEGHTCERIADFWNGKVIKRGLGFDLIPPNPQP